MRKEIVLSVVFLLIFAQFPLLSAQTLTVSVWTDKNEYYIGESASIYFVVSVDAYVRVILIKPDVTVILAEGNVMGGVTYQLKGTVGCPPGPRKVVVEAYAGSEVAEGYATYVARLVFDIDVEVDVYSNYTSIIMVKYSPYYTPWDYFKSNCYDKNPSSYHMEQVELISNITGIPSTRLTVLNEDVGTDYFYTVVRTELNYSPYCDVEKAVLVFQNPVLSLSDRNLVAFTVFCERGICCASPSPSLSYQDKVIWYNPTAASFKINSSIYVYVSVSGIPSGTLVDLYVDGLKKTSVSPGSFVKISLPGGVWHSLAVKDKVGINGYVYMCSMNKTFTCRDSRIVFTYAGPYIEINLSVNIPVIINVTIQGSSYEIPGTFLFSPNTSISIEAPEVKQLDSSSRIVFVRWSDGVNTSSRVIVVDRPMELTLIYVKQYLVKVVDPIGGQIGATSGGGWYNEGDTAELRIIQDIINVSSGERYVFKEWSGDISSSNPTITVQVNKPITVNVVWRHQYLVSVKTDHSNAILTPSSPDGWYDEGTTVTVKIEDESIQDTPFTGYRFKGWIFEDTGQLVEKVEVSFTVDKPITLRAVWERTYNIILILAVVGIAGASVVGLALLKKVRGPKPGIPGKIPPPELPPPPSVEEARPAPKAPPPPVPPIERKIPVVGPTAFRPISREEIISLAGNASTAGIIGSKHYSIISSHPLTDESTRYGIYSTLQSLLFLRQVADSRHMDKVYKEGIKIVKKYIESLF